MTFKSLVLVFLSVGILQAQENSKDVHAVQRTIKELFQSLSNRDSISLKNSCAVDIQLFEYGKIWNVDTLIRKAIVQNTSTDFKRTNTFDFIGTTVSRNTAWASYYIKSEFTKDGKESFVQWLETIILVKDKKSWKVKVLHSTLVKKG